MLVNRIRELIEPTINAMGLELWSCQLHNQGQYSSLRVLIDSESGVTVDHCTQVSREISALLDVEDAIKNRYQLEVSSPGIDRVLLTLPHFARYIGYKVKVRLRVPQSHHRQFIGRIEKIEGDRIVFNVDNEIISVTLNEIQKANLGCEEPIIAR